MRSYVLTQTIRSLSLDQVTTHLTLALSTVPLGGITSEALLALRGTGIKNVAEVQFAYKVK